MRDFNLPTLWSISIHEVSSRPLPPALPAPAAGRVEGPVSNAARAGVVRGRLGALPRYTRCGSRLPSRRHQAQARPGPPKRSRRLARFVVAIRLHCEDLSSSRACASSGDEAFLEEATARREAERGTFDPSNRVSRRQADAAEASTRLQGIAGGESLDWRTFHDAVLAQGNAPLLGPSPVSCWTRAPTRPWSKRCRCTVRMRRVQSAVRVIRKFSDPPWTSRCAGRGRLPACVTGDSIQGGPVSTSRITQKRGKGQGKGARRKGARQKGARPTPENRREVRVTKSDSASADSGTKSDSKSDSTAKPESSTPASTAKSSGPAKD